MFLPSTPYCALKFLRCSSMLGFLRGQEGCVHQDVCKKGEGLSGQRKPDYWPTQWIGLVPDEALIELA